MSYHTEDESTEPPIKKPKNLRQPSIVEMFSSKSTPADVRVVKKCKANAEDLSHDSQDTIDVSFSGSESSEELPEDSAVKIACRGLSVELLRRTPKLKSTLAELSNCLDNVTVLFDVQNSSRGESKYFDEFVDRWDDDRFAKMPFSPFNSIPIYGMRDSTDGWTLIQKYLTKGIKSYYDFRKLIYKFNPDSRERWNLSTMKEFLTDVFDEAESEPLYAVVLPGMMRLALDAQRVCRKPLPLLIEGMNHTVVMTQYQIACLLANAFFCTIPRQDNSRLPGVNFNTLYSPGRKAQKVEKLKCLFNYFRRVLKDKPDGVVSFRRQAIYGFPDWQKSTKSLSELRIAADGVIETQGHGMLQADFANKYLGGGVLGNGLVQEEIRFLICPEMIISRLFVERLADNEALIMTGCEQYSSYTGYSRSFEFAGDFKDETPRDSWRRRMTEVVAIDALVFRSKSDQFSKRCIDRELNKAYSGFLSNGDNPTAIATGNWGCGAFGGDKHLKAIIQVLAASQAGRQVFYFTFGDSQLVNDVYELHQRLIDKSLTVGDVYSQLIQYCSVSSSVGLYEYISANLGYTDGITSRGSQHDDITSHDSQRDMFADSDDS